MSSELEISITDSEEGRAEPCTIPHPVLAIAKSAKKLSKTAQIEICVFRGAEEVYPVVLNDAHMTTQISMYRTIAML